MKLTKSWNIFCCSEKKPSCLNLSMIMYAVVTTQLSSWSWPLKDICSKLQKRNGLSLYSRHTIMFDFLFRFTKECLWKFEFLNNSSNCEVEGQCHRGCEFIESCLNFKQKEEFHLLWLSYKGQINHMQAQMTHHRLCQLLIQNQDNFYSIELYHSS